MKNIMCLVKYETHKFILYISHYWGIIEACVFKEHSTYLTYIVHCLCLVAQNLWESMGLLITP